MLKLGSGRVWLSDAGVDCYDGLRTIDSSISAEDGGRFSCTVNGGIPPITYNWRASPGGQTGAASSFEPELANGTHSVTLLPRMQAAGPRKDTVAVKIT